MSFMHQSADRSGQDLRPHLVMAVGNLVVGDSRVEKAAISARDLGYKVTVVGVRRRTVQQVSFIDGDIPVVRLPIGHENHDRIAAAVAAREDRLAWRRRQINRLRKPLKRPAYLAHRSVVRSREAGVKASRRLGRSWRTLWPHLVDYETTFFDAFKALEPDIVHVHDRHPLPGAAQYSRWAAQTPGVRPVLWLYDAHEYVPTQHLPPPVEQQEAWIAVEAECIQRADAVLTVTDEIAELLRRSHRLAEAPTVVRNLPSTTQADKNTLRTDVRSAVGLASDVPLAVYAGGIAPQRGVSTLLEAQALFPELHVAVLCKNDGDLREDLRKQAKRLGTQKRLHLLDYVPASHVSKFLSTADVGISALLPSAAHQAAAPTKVSEYLHARLPVVVSDMRAQAERVRRLGFGAIYPSGDSKAMAETLKYVLAHASEYKEKITDGIILENSWEADVPGLESIWANLSPHDRQVQPPKRHEEPVTVFSREGGAEKAWGPAFEVLGKRTSVLTALPQLKRIRGDLTDGRFVLTEDGLRFLDFWRHEAARLRGVFYENPISLVDSWSPALTTGILSMSGKPAIRLLANKTVFDVDRLRARHPYHWLHEISDQEADRLRSEFVELRESIGANDRRVMTNCLTSSWSLGNVSTFLPSPLAVGNRNDRPLHEPLRLGWFADQRRSASERTALESLHSAVGPELNVIEIENQNTSTDLSDFDIIIDSLSADLPTASGLRALAAGCVLVTGSADEQSNPDGRSEVTSVIADMPLVYSSPDAIHSTVTSLLQDRQEVAERRRQSRTFALQQLSLMAVVARMESMISACRS